MPVACFILQTVLACPGPFSYARTRPDLRGGDVRGSPATPPFCSAPSALPLIVYSCRTSRRSMTLRTCLRIAAPFWTAAYVRAPCWDLWGYSSIQ